MNDTIKKYVISLLENNLNNDITKLKEEYNKLEKTLKTMKIDNELDKSNCKTLKQILKNIKLVIKERNKNVI